MLKAVFIQWLLECAFRASFRSNGADYVEESAACPLSCYSDHQIYVTHACFDAWRTQGDLSVPCAYPEALWRQSISREAHLLSMNARVLGMKQDESPIEAMMNVGDEKT